MIDENQYGTVHSRRGNNEHKMSRLLSTENRIEILEIYRNCDSAAKAARIFNERHLTRNSPLNRSSVIRIADKFRQTGSVFDTYKRGRKPILENAEAVDNILQRFEADPHLSIRQASVQLGHSKKTVNKVLKASSFHPYKFQNHQLLLEIDYPRRRNFCEWFTIESIVDPELGQKVLWTDECLFTLNGQPNKQTYR